MTPEQTTDTLFQATKSGSIADAKATLDAGADAQIDIHKLYELAIAKLVGNDLRKLQRFEFDERYESCRLRAYDGHDVIVKREGRTGRWFVEFKHRHEFPIYFESAEQLEELITTDLSKNPPEPVLERRLQIESERLHATKIVNEKRQKELGSTPTAG